MSYILKQFDTPLLRFNIERDIDGIKAEILWENEEERKKLPLDLSADEKSLEKWLKNRTIPGNRAYVHNFLAKLGLNEKDTKGIIDFCKGLSLNDCYWVVAEGFSGSFADNNLYDNRFSQTLSYMAFTGYGSFLKSSLRSSPEFTTNGMLAKCWRRINGKIYLFKSGTEGFANSGKEPYSEFYAYQAANAMGLTAVKYGLSKWKGRFCSTCELFTSKELSFIPVGKLVREGGIRSVMSFYGSLGKDYEEALKSMLVYDAVVCNTDRHYGNFGFMVDNHTNRIVMPAPLFDHGLALFPEAMEDDLLQLVSYAAVRTPAAYNDFMEMAAQCIGPVQKEQLRRLIGFRFKKHSRYNLPDKRLRALESFIAERVRLLLDV